MNKSLSILLGTIITTILVINPHLIQSYLHEYTTIGLFIPMLFGFILSMFMKGKKVTDEEFPKFFKIMIGDKEISKKSLNEEKTFIIGRKGCDVNLDFNFIDDVHLNIKKMKTFISVCVLTDKAIHLNRQRLKKNKFVEIRLGDVVQLGKIKIIFY